VVGMIGCAKGFRMEAWKWLFRWGELAMKTDWIQVVTDIDEKKVFEALADKTWDWRTINALCGVSGLSEKQVQKTLAKYPVLVRKSRVPSKKGEDLYTLQERYLARKSIFEKILTFTSSSSSSI